MTDSAHFVRPDVQGVLSALAAMGAPPMNEVPLADARAGYVAMAAMLEADPLPLPVIRDLACPGPGGDIPLRLYDARETREPGPVIMFYHGGGFVIGDLDSHHALCTEIAAVMDLPVVAVHYRLAPEHPYPAAADDCEAATRWVASNPAALGRTATGLIPIGDSAGGNLVIVTGAALRAKAAAVPIVMQVPIYPATDESDSGSMQDFAEGFLLTRDVMQWFMASYAPTAGDVRAYPLGGDHRGTAPTVLVTASLDPLRDQGRRYGAALIEAGVDVTFMEMRGLTHGFVNLRKAVPSAQTDTHAIFTAMKLLLGRISG